MKAGSSGESRDYDRVKAYIAVRKQTDRTKILMGTGISAGDVKAIAARLAKEEKIRIDELPTGGATYLWTGGPVQVAAAAKGVTPAPAADPGTVTPKKPAPGVTKASPGPRRGVTPKEKQELEILMDRAMEIEKLSVPSNGAAHRLDRIGKMMSILSGLAAGVSDDDTKEQLTRLASEALKWRIELLDPEQRDLLNGLFGLTGGTA